MVRGRVILHAVGNDTFNRNAIGVRAHADGVGVKHRTIHFSGIKGNTEVLVGAGKECLIGTALLNPHRLEIDYEHRTVQLLQGTNW